MFFILWPRPLSRKFARGEYFPICWQQLNLSRKLRTSEPPKKIILSKPNLTAAQKKKKRCKLLLKTGLWKWIDGSLSAAGSLGHLSCHLSLRNISHEREKECWRTGLNYLTQNHTPTRINSQNKNPGTSTRIAAGLFWPPDRWTDNVSDFFSRPLALPKYILHPFLRWAKATKKVVEFYGPVLAACAWRGRNMTVDSGYSSRVISSAKVKQLSAGRCKRNHNCTCSPGW